MNYLAHLTLAYPDDGLIIGNFIGDHVRNKELPFYEKHVQQGVSMHRAIDLFTDKHHETIGVRQLLFDDYRHYSSVLVDIYYDHFLAKHFDRFHEHELASFVPLIEHILRTYNTILPASAQRYLKGMITQRWLLMYKDISGVDFILKMMAKRSTRDHLETGIQGLLAHYTSIEQKFLAFYPELMDYCVALKKDYT
jgi:acyl carrier protein phosphodiesterase